MFIFDLGGDIFDVSILKIKPLKRLRFNLSTVTPIWVGGKDFDIFMVNHCVEEFHKMKGMSFQKMHGQLVG